MKSAALFLALALVVPACSSSDDNGTSPPPDAGPDSTTPDGGPTEREVARLPPISGQVKLTDVQTLVPTHAVAPEMIEPSAREPEVRTQQLADGFGAFTTGPGESMQVETPDGAAAPKRGDNPRRLTRFAHLADFQLADDESPTRLAIADGPGFREAAYRPQEGHECRVVNAVVRTVNRIHKEKDAAFDFVVLGGDNADSAQQNELDWVLKLLGGADKLACDSGDLNDPVPGANNDGKDPFAPEGLDVPWYWVTGNHDILVQGNFVVNADRIAQSKGGNPSVGTRDYRLPGSPVTTESVPADVKRAAMPRGEMIDRVLADKGKAGPLAHGLGDYAVQTKKAYYEQNLGDSGLRLIVIDSAAESGGSDGLLRKPDIENFVKPALERAKKDKKWVLFASHHAAEDIKDGSGLDGKPQDDAFPAKDWEALLVANPHVIGHLAGHTHVHKVRHVAAPAPAMNGYWEIRTSAIADYPHQFRTIEVWDEDNGYLSIRSVAVDYSTENDSVAEMGRTLGILDYTSHGVGAGQGAPKDRNVILWLKKPGF